MRLFSKLIFSFLLSFISIGLASAQVSVPSQTFDLGTNVDGVWDQTAQTLTVQGNGKIDRNKWFHVKGTLGLEQTALNKIEFKSGVQFPDNASWFFWSVKTANILFPVGMDTTNLNNVYLMFAEAVSFDWANIESWDVSNVENFKQMFDWALAFNQDLSRWNTKSATDMSYMFRNTKNFSTPLYFKDTSKVLDMKYMFYNSKVPSVKLEKTGKVGDMQYMFLGSQVENVEFDDTSSVTDMQFMFSEAKKFNAGNIADWDVSKVKNFFAMFHDDSIQMSFNQDLGRWNTESATNMSYMFNGTKSLNRPLHFKNVGKVTNMFRMFSYSGVPSVKLEKTGKVQNMERMFNGSQVECVYLDDTSSVTNMAIMFLLAPKLNCGNIADWDVSNVENFYAMFHSASTQESFNQDLSRWNTESATNMSYMFYNAKEFKSPVYFKNVWNVANMEYMFSYSGVPSVKLEKTGKVENMQNMFNTSKVQKVEIDDTSNIKNMYGMFAFAKNLSEWNMSEWDTSKVKNFSAMFYGASQFNQDLSNWNLSSASNLDGFIWSDDSFEQDNYEKFLEKIEASNLDPATMQNRTIHVSTTYCAAASIRNKLTARGFVLNDKGMDCKIQVTFDAPTKQASGDIVDTKIRVSAKLPLDPTKVTILPQTTIGNQDLSCQKDGDDNHLVCSIKLTSTQRGNRLAVQAALDVAISSWTRIPSPTPWQAPTYQEAQTTTTLSSKAEIDGYLIDRIGPEKAQIKIDTTNGINKPVVSLAQLPNDVGIGLNYCVMRADDGNYDENTHLEINTPYPLVLASSNVHSVWVKCYDRLGNSSESEVRFPPIVEFAQNDVLRNDQIISGAVEVYAPLNDDGTENLISRIWVNNEHGENIKILSCTDYARTQYTQGVAALKNKPGYPIKCTFSGAFPAGKDIHDVQIRAEAKNGAIWWSSQTFVRDEIAPQITITPESAFTWSDLTIQVKVFDAIAIDSNGVTVAPDSELVVEDRSCKAEPAGSRTNIECTGKVKNEVKDGLLKIVARDRAGNKAELSYATYTIDKSSPDITIVKFDLDDTKQRSQYTIEVMFADRWPAGLWKSSEAYDPAALSYGVGDDQNCTNYQYLGTLQPGENEPYEIKFDFAHKQFNGKYLCIKAVDKVGNSTLKASSTPLNVNIAPEVDWASFQVDEHHQDKPISVKTIGDITARDANGDTMTYTIFSGNDAGIFTFDGNTLKTVAGKALDFETKPVHTLTVRVTDQYGLTGDAKVVITLKDLDENPPQINTIPNQRIKKNRPVQISIEAKDDVGVKGIEISGLPKGLVYNPTTKKIEGSTSDAVRDRTITVKVVDNQGNVAIKTFTLTVVGSRHDDTSGGGKTCYGDCWTNPVSPDNGPSVQPTPQPDQKPQTNPNDNKKPDQKPVEKTEWKLIKHEDTVIFNPTVENGKCYTRREYLGIKDSETLVTSEEFKKALSFLRTYEMTMFDSVDGFAPKRNLSREEAAKIFSNFAINVLCRKPDKNLSIHYSDVENADPTLKPYITLAYQLGVMKGSGMGDGEFRPFDAITKAEVNAVLIRMILKSYLDESKTEGKRWYSEYNRVATELGILKQGAGAEPVSRNNVALMLFRAYKNQVFDWRNIDYFSYVLKSRDLFVK